MGRTLVIEHNYVVCKVATHGQTNVIIMHETVIALYIYFMRAIVCAILYINTTICGWYYIYTCVQNYDHICTTATVESFMAESDIVSTL